MTNPSVDLMDFADIISVIRENMLLYRLVIFFAYLVAAKLVDLIIDKILRRLAEKTRVTFDDILLDIFHAPVCWLVVFLGLLHGLMIEPLAAPWGLVMPALVQSFMLVIGMVAMVRFFNWLMEVSLKGELVGEKIGRELFLLLKNLIRVIFVLLGLLWLLAIWDIDLTPVFASAGIAGVAVALAAKDSLANFFGGISIFLDNTYKLGDYIILDNTDRGEVVEIGIRSTRIKTRDDVLITVPNAIMANSKIINESAPVPRFRIRVPVGVAYGSDPRQVEAILLKIAGLNPGVSDEPAARVRLRALADSSINFELLCWVKDPSAKGFETHNLLSAAYRAFAEEGVEIPFPQRVVHLTDH